MALQLQGKLLLLLLLFLNFIKEPKTQEKKSTPDGQGGCVVHGSALAFEDGPRPAMSLEDNVLHV